jgi:hypothetical protein
VWGGGGGGGGGGGWGGVGVVVVVVVVVVRGCVQPASQRSLLQRGGLYYHVVEGVAGGTYQRHWLGLRWSGVQSAATSPQLHVLTAVQHAMWLHDWLMHKHLQCHRRRWHPARTWAAAPAA